MYMYTHVSLSLVCVYMYIYIYIHIRYMLHTMHYHECTLAYRLHTQLHVFAGLPSLRHLLRHYQFHLLLLALL